MLKAVVMGLGLAAMATAANADPLFDAFQSLCVKQAGDGQATLQAAEAASWQVVPDAMKQQLGGGFKLQNFDARMKSDAAGLSFVLVGNQALPLGGQKVSVKLCAVATTAATGEASTKALADWAAVPSTPELGSDGQGFAFTEEPTGHKLLEKPKDPNDPEVRALLGSGKVRMAFSRAAPNMTVLAYAVVPKI
jgi:hypothetical protein